MKRLAIACLAACGSSPPPAPASGSAPAVAIDAAPAPDADPYAALADAPAYIFKYDAAGRVETWTLRYRDNLAVLLVETSHGNARYVGTARDDAELALDLATGATKLALTCKREKLAVGTVCGDKAPKQRDVLACYHPDFKAPMSFGPAPGLAYVATDKCSGYVVMPGS